MVDVGVVGKIVGEGKSLLLIGMIVVEGEFLCGDVIVVCDLVGLEIVCGLVNYVSLEVWFLCCRLFSDFECLFGYVVELEMIYWDNLVFVCG